MDYKVLAFDLDGTLLNAHQEITRRTLETIEKLKSMGQKIVIITGRSFNACSYYSKLVDADYTIACNGAFTYDNQKNIIRNKLPLDIELSRQALKVLYEKKDHLKIQWDSIETYYSNNVTPFEIRYIENYKRDYPEMVFSSKVIESFNQIRDFNEEIYQIFFHPMGENKDPYFETIEELKQFDNINVVDFKNHCTDINHDNATKGNGLKTLADLLEVSNEQIVVFGDGDNDVTMFEYAGLAVAMDNACEEVKKLSDMITDHHDDEGVVNALEKIFYLS